MELTIITPEKKEQFTISWIELNNPSGNRVIQPGHAPLILSLVAGKPFIFGLADGTTIQRVIRTTGFAHISRTSVSILASDAQPL